MPFYRVVAYLFMHDTTPKGFPPSYDSYIECMTGDHGETDATASMPESRQLHGEER